VAAERIIRAKQQPLDAEPPRQRFQVREAVLRSLGPEIRAGFQAIWNVEMEVPTGVAHHESPLWITAGEIGDLVGHREIWRAARDVDQEIELQRHLDQ